MLSLDDCVRDSVVSEEIEFLQVNVQVWLNKDRLARKIFLYIKQPTGARNRRATS
jgi:hypothetical protein